MRAGADLGFNMVGITLLYRKGYFRQHLDEAGVQSESPFDWTPEAFLEPLPIECLPVDDLAECARSVLLSDGRTVLSYGSPSGYEP